ncbi:Leptomycin B resistance protein-like protein [Rhypophila decipiens]
MAAALEATDDITEKGQPIITQPTKEEVALDISFSDGDSKKVEPEKKKGNAYFRIFSYATTFDRSIQAVAFLAAITSGAGQALQNLIFGEFVTVITNYVAGTASADDFRHEAGQLALFFTYMGIGRFALAYIYNVLLNYAAYRIVKSIQTAYVKAALSQEIAFFDLGTGGSIAAQATTNGRLIQAGIVEKLGLTFQGLSTFVTAFIIAFIVNWKLTLYCLFIAPGTIIIMGIVGAFFAEYELKILAAYGQANSFAEGVLASARTIHAFEMRSRLVAKFDEYLKEGRKWGDKCAPLMGLLFSVEYTIIYMGFGLAFWKGTRMFADGDISDAGDVFLVIFSVVIGSLALTAMAPYMSEFSRATSAAEQLFELIDRQSAINPFDESGAQPDDTIGGLEIENLTFAYPTRPDTTVLDNFSLSIPAGKVTALVGQSGSGKSTIIGLIERWYNPTSGSIKLDGRPIDSLNLGWLRKHVRLVQQEPVLFQGTVYENIAHGLVGTPYEHASKEEKMAQIENAAKTAFAHDFITELPQGYETQIGQRGGLLSGGQKQRIAIARSVVSQPKILLLDEATSALDPHAEGIVQQALDRASEGRTTIVIAHKLATIRKADNIVVMSKGKIVEQGSHEGLISQDGVYAHLVRIQDLGLKSIAGAGSGSDTEAEGDAVVAAPLEQSTSQTAYLAKTQSRAAGATDLLDSPADRYDYEATHKSHSLGSVIYRLYHHSARDLKVWFLLTLLGCFLGAAAFPGQALLLAKVMDVFTLPRPEMITQGEFFAKMFVAMACGLMVVWFGMGYASSAVSQGLTHQLRRESLEGFLKQDISFFDREENTTGALVSRVDGNAQAVFELMGMNVGLVFVSVIQVLACSVLAIAHSWKIGLVVVFAGLPPLIGSGFLKIRSDVKLARQRDKRMETGASIASEAITAIRTVSSLAIEDKVLARYVNELHQANQHSIKPLCGMMVWFAITQGVEYWFMALGFWYGCRLLSFGEVNMYNFMVAFLGVFFSGQGASQFFQFSTSMTKGKNAAEYIFWLGSLVPSIQENPENKDRAPKAGEAVHLDHIRFSYPLRPDTAVLKGVDLEIQKGQFVAVVGASGCGKSTVVALLERFYDPTTGTVRIDSSDALVDLNPRLYRRIVSLVQQEPTLFQGTIRENIALGVDSSHTADDVSVEVSDEQIESALKAANAWDFVSSLPEGLSTQAGASGTQLSGGQRQRIAIARSLIRNPKILLLDEATSALDTESEKIVQGALAEAAQQDGRITVAVAHRLSTIRDAHLICVFYNGRIVERGTHAELLAKGGLYRGMCEAQSIE